MKKPIDVLLDGVTWKPVVHKSECADVLYATHEGILSIQGFSFHVYQLNNGQRVISSDDLE